MTNKKVEKWLEEKSIKLEESFSDALKNLSKKSKRTWNQNFIINYHFFI